MILALRVGQRIDVALDGQGVDFASETLELLDDAGTVIATAVADPLGVDAENFDLAILGFVVPDLGTNVYTVRFASLTVGDYALLVTDALSLESEPNNNSEDPLRNFSDLGKPALGYLEGDADIDQFQLNVINGQTVTVQLVPIFNAADSQPLNDLDPELVVTSPFGGVIASDRDSLDGRGASIQFVATGIETLTIQAISTSGSGAYLLTATATQGTGPPAELIIDSVESEEGDNGITSFTFAISRTHNQDPVLLDVGTSSGTAIAGEDFLALEQPVFFPTNGALTAFVTVNVLGDTSAEADEQFTVNLSNVFGATVAQGTGVGTIVNDDDAVRIQGVRLGSSAWVPEFLTEIDPTQGLGYPIGTGAEQFEPAPWGNVNTIYVEFNSDVSGSFTADRVTLAGVNVADYSPLISSVSFDSEKLTGVIQLSEAIGSDQLLLGIDDSVTDLQGSALDGDWVDGISVGESGDGSAGGDFSFRFNVLPSDMNQDTVVNIFDLNLLGLAFDSVIGSDAYSTRIDANGDGAINVFDLNNLGLAFGTALPDGQPGAPPLPSVAAAIESVFDDRESLVDEDLDDELLSSIAEDLEAKAFVA